MKALPFVPFDDAITIRQKKTRDGCTVVQVGFWDAASLVSGDADWLFTFPLSTRASYVAAGVIGSTLHAPTADLTLAASVPELYHCYYASFRTRRENFDCWYFAAFRTPPRTLNFMLLRRISHPSENCAMNIIAAIVSAFTRRRERFH